MKSWNLKLADKLQTFSEYFTSAYYREDLGEDPRFSSLTTAVFRKLLHWPLYLITGIWLCAIIYGITQQTSFWALLPVSLFHTAWILLAGFVLFLILMLIEAVAKILTSLILYGQLPEGAENPVDGLLAYLTQGRI